VLDAESGRAGLPFGPFAVPGAIALSPRQALDIFDIGLAKGRRSNAPLQVIAERLGCELPDRPNRAAVGTSGTALWLGPRHWYLVRPSGDPLVLARALQAAVRDLDVAVTDVGQGKCVFRLRGSRARDLLAKSCPAEINARVFCAGACMVTLVAELPMLLHAVDDRPSFDLYFDRSYAQSTMELLLHQAGEYGAISVPAGERA
jgi:sarcosine oxidase subunit gamma